MFKRILVANRGEVAARVIRTCNRLGIETVAVCSSADRDLTYLEEASHVICIGGPLSKDSYLDADAILETARLNRCSALHPGWGFLSENANFAARCEQLGITFIGPPPNVIKTLGDKAQARSTMKQLGLQVIPGTGELSGSIDEIIFEAAKIGYPLLVKAIAGGGGKGMKLVYQPDDLPSAINEAKSQALSAFGDSRLYIELFKQNAKHIEIQILADQFGNSISLGTRDCSIQRQRQKLIEESPAPNIVNSEITEQKAAMAMAAAGYVGAGTVEMLMDNKGEMYFMECNTRLQVEHPVTEQVTGLDLVEWQLKTAVGQPPFLWSGLWASGFK